MDHKPPPDQHRHEPPAQGRGCLAMFLAGLCLLWAASVGLVVGTVAYFVAAPLGIATIGASVTGGVAAFLIVFLCMPAGAAIFFLVLAPDGSQAMRSLAAVLVVLLGVLFQFELVVFFAGLSAVGGVFLFRCCEPLWAALITAILFPILGILFGVMWGGDRSPE